MHQRTPSHSYRIPITASIPPSHLHLGTSTTSPTSTAAQHAPRPRKRHTSVDDPLLSPGWNSSSPGGGHDAAAGGWITSRLGGRPALKRWMLIALGLSASYALIHTATTSSGDSTTSASSIGGAGTPSSAFTSWWSTSTKGSSPDPDQDDLDDWFQPPRVDRTALEKLRLLEIHYGADEDEIDKGDETGGAGGAGTAGLSPGEKGDTDIAAQGKGGAAAAGQLATATDAPPLVAEIPEFVKPDPLAPPAPEKVPAHILDRRVCGAINGDSCRFLVPAWLGEQETKAQQHLYQLGLLALALNRTLVLPNVSKSRLGTCYQNPFSFYYSPSSLSELGIPTISQEDFIDWTLRRETSPSAQVVMMGNAKADYSLGAIEIDSSADPYLVPSKPSRNLCLRAPKTRLDFSRHSPLSIYPPEGYHKSEAGRLGFGEKVITTLRSRKVVSKSSRLSSSTRAKATVAPPDVLGFNYELRFPILSPAVSSAFAAPSLPQPSPFSHFAYADVWNSLGEQLVERLSPFVAIHWRTETLLPANLAPCGQSLINKLLELKRSHPTLRNVYLATDYPIESLDPTLGAAAATEAGEEAVAHSGTFAKSVTPQHHTAMRRFLRDFKKRFAKGQLRLTTFAREQAELAAEADSVLPPALAQRLIELTTPSLRPAVAGDDVSLSSPVTASEAILSLARVDSGLYGILDKLVAMRAELFVTGVPGLGSSTVGACAKLSSFTNQLIAAREERIAAGEEGLWNTVEHFALDGK
ncbi:hypothetical protein JCM10908_005484 [Rhodotorula pacifica]|uniref:uncharacterized protein n=1 Tax=Rhodotorula pacifica TaxID=1495444 RepID=UPI00317C39D6